MSHIYYCDHHKMAEGTHGDVIHRVCGCDGTIHHACEPIKAPEGTEKPANWPICLAWPDHP